MSSPTHSGQWALNCYMYLDVKQVGVVARQKLKQTLVRTRDQWETLSPTEFNETGEVRGYRVANIRSTMRVSIQGETELDKKRLDFSLTGGDNNPKRVFVSVPYDQVVTLVEQLYKVDELLRQ